MDDVVIIIISHPQEMEWGLKMIFQKLMQNSEMHVSNGVQAESQNENK